MSSAAPTPMRPRPTTAGAAREAAQSFDRKEAADLVATLDASIDQLKALLDQAEKWAQLQSIGLYEPLLRLAAAPYNRLRSQILKIKPEEFAVAQARAEAGYELARSIAAVVKRRGSLEKELEDKVMRRELIAKRAGRT